MDHAPFLRPARSRPLTTDAIATRAPASRGDGAATARRPAENCAPPGSTSGPGEPRADAATREASTAAEAIRVLVVDDQPDVLATTVELFKIMGFEVLCANNGEEAIAILESTREVHVLFKLIPGINVILASGFQALTMDPRDTDLRDFHFLSKPFRMADIARMLRK
jgi:hypothetical protein